MAKILNSKQWISIVEQSVCNCHNESNKELKQNNPLFFWGDALSRNGAAKMSAMWVRYFETIRYECKGEETQNKKGSSLWGLLIWSQLCVIHIEFWLFKKLVVAGREAKTRISNYFSVVTNYFDSYDVAVHICDLNNSLQRSFR